MNFAVLLIPSSDSRHLPRIDLGSPGNSTVKSSVSLKGSDIFIVNSAARKYRAIKTFLFEIVSRVSFIIFLL